MKNKVHMLWHMWMHSQNLCAGVVTVFLQAHTHWPFMFTFGHVATLALSIYPNMKVNFQFLSWGSLFLYQPTFCLEPGCDRVNPVRSLCFFYSSGDTHSEYIRSLINNYGS